MGKMIDSDKLKAELNIQNEADRMRVFNTIDKMDVENAVIIDRFIETMETMDVDDAEIKLGVIRNKVYRVTVKVKVVEDGEDNN